MQTARRRFASRLTIRTRAGSARALKRSAVAAASPPREPARRAARNTPPQLSRSAHIDNHQYIDIVDTSRQKRPLPLRHQMFTARRPGARMGGRTLAAHPEGIRKRRFRRHAHNALRHRCRRFGGPRDGRVRGSRRRAAGRQAGRFAARSGVDVRRAAHRSVAEQLQGRVHHVQPDRQRRRDHRDQQSQRRLRRLRRADDRRPAHELQGLHHAPVGAVRDSRCSTTCRASRTTST